MTNCPQVGVVRIMWHILELYSPWNIFATAKARDFKFCTRVGPRELLATRWLTVSQVGVARITWHIFEFYTPWNISGTAKARNFKIRILVGLVKCQLCDAWLFPRWTGSWSRDPFLHFWAQAISLERIKPDISNLVCRLNVKSTGIKHVKVLQYGVYLGSRDLLTIFTARCCAFAVLAMALCLYVRPTQVGVLLKRLFSQCADK